MLWLSANRRLRWAHKAVLLLEADHHLALWSDEMPKSWTQADTRKAVCSLMSLQLVPVLPGLDCLNFGGVPRDDCAALYARFALCGYYVCMSSSRASLRMLVLMRKAAPDATFIFVCRVDSRTRIAAIANLLLNAPVGLTTFVGADRHSSCGSLVASRGNVAPFDSDAALGVDSSSRVGWPCAVDLTGLPCPGGFGAMYAAHVHRRCVSSGVFYAHCNPVLLATWCGTRGAVMDWPLLRRKWGSGCPPAALSRVVCEITGAKAERLWLRDAALVGQRPATRGWLRVPCPALLPYRCGQVRLVFFSGDSENKDCGTSRNAHGPCRACVLLHLPRTSSGGSGMLLVCAKTCAATVLQRRAC
eukprot:s5614_g4.t1